MQLLKRNDNVEQWSDTGLYLPGKIFTASRIGIKRFREKLFLNF